MIPLFGALPGGIEMLGMLVMMLLMLAIPLVIAVGMFLLGRWSASRGSDVSEAELAELRGRVDELEAQLESGDVGDDEQGDDTASTEAAP